MTGVRRRAYLNLAGQFNNVGDGIIRRRALDWVRGVEEVHVYVGDAPQEWVTQLRLDPGTVVYRPEQHARWMRGAALAGRRALVVLAPGETSLLLRDLPREVKLLALAALLRATGGAMVSPPRHVRFSAAPTIAVHRLSARLLRVAMWRTQQTADRMGVGESLPDIGFDETPVVGDPWAERGTLMVSLRGKRPVPSRAWTDGVTAFARRQGLHVQTFAQVSSDEERARELAGVLGAEHLPWGDRDLLAHEEHLRQAYGRARLVLSDRLHVVIMAMLSGALVAEVVDAPSEKVRDHLAQVGLTGLTLDSATTDADGVADFLDGVLARRSEVADRLATGRARLAEAADRVRAMVEVRSGGTRR